MLIFLTLDEIYHAVKKTRSVLIIVLDSKRPALEKAFKNEECAPVSINNLKRLNIHFFIDKYIII